MRKIRNKRKNKKINPLVYILIIVVMLSSGYAIFTDNINLAGSANTVDQNRLNNKWNIYQSPWYSQIVTAHANLARSTENMVDGNRLTTTFTVSSSNNTQRNLALRLTFTNLNRYTLASGVIQSGTTTCSNATISTQTISAVSIAYNATMTFNTTLRLRTSQARNCQYDFVIRYTYSTKLKYFYYTVRIL